MGGPGDEEGTANDSLTEDRLKGAAAQPGEGKGEAQELARNAPNGGGSAAGPQLKMDDEGNIILDEASLVQPAFFGDSALEPAEFAPQLQAGQGAAGRAKRKAFFFD